MTEPARGVLAMIGACTIWGLSPLYYALLKHVPPLEVLSYRTLWSLVFFAAVLALQGRIVLLPRALRGGRLPVIAFAGVMIATNWFGFIFGIQAGRAVEASLGYYIFPLAAVLLGRLIFSEPLSVAQWLAVGLAALAVGTLTAGLGAAPWLSLLLAGTFAAYGVVKKGLDIAPMVSVTAEVLLLAPLALWFALWQAAGRAGPPTHLFARSSGPLTATPLILFSYAARARALCPRSGLTPFSSISTRPCNSLVRHPVAVPRPFTGWHLWLCPIFVRRCRSIPPPPRPRRAAPVELAPQPGPHPAHDRQERCQRPFRQSRPSRLSISGDQRDP